MLTNCVIILSRSIFWFRFSIVSVFYLILPKSAETSASQISNHPTFVSIKQNKQVPVTRKTHGHVGTI